MKVPMSVLKLTVTVPTVLASAALWVVVLALLPPILGLLAFVAGVATLGLLAVGLVERPVIRLLFAARTAMPGEDEALAPLVARLAGLGIASGREVLIRGGAGPRTPPAQLVGDGVLVVTRWLVEAPACGRLALDEAVALVAHAHGRRQAQRPHTEVAMLVLTLPARAVVATVASLARGLAGVPFLRFAWSIRGLVGAVAVAQQNVEGRPLLGICSGVIVALSYLIPAASRATAARVEASADAVVVGYGLGPALATVMARYQLPVSRARMQRLSERPAADPEQPVSTRRLELVRG